MIALLSLANAAVYIQKTNPSFFSRFIPHNESKSDSWLNEDPGWRNNEDFPKSENQPKVDPVPPKADPVPPKNQPKTQPKPQEPQKRPFRRNIDPNSSPG